MQAEGYPHPCNGAGRSGKGEAKRRSAQAERGRLGERLARAWGLAPRMGSALRQEQARSGGWWMTAKPAGTRENAFFL